MKPSISKEDQRTLRRIRREGKVADMADGRRERAAVFASPKDYRRKPKHPVDYQDMA